MWSLRFLELDSYHRHHAPTPSPWFFLGKLSPYTNSPIITQTIHSRWVKKVKHLSSRLGRTRPSFLVPDTRTNTHQYALIIYPKQSMYGICTYIYHNNQPFMEVNIPVPWIQPENCCLEPTDISHWTMIMGEKSSKGTLPETNIAMENPPFWWYLLGKMGIFMGYVSFRGVAKKGHLSTFPPKRFNSKLPPSPRPLTPRRAPQPYRIPGGSPKPPLFGKTLYLFGLPETHCRTGEK